MYGVKPLDAAEHAVVSNPGSEKRTRFLDLVLDGVKGGPSSELCTVEPAAVGLLGEIASLRRLPRRSAMG